MNESSQIPASWQWSTMGEVAEVVGGGTPKTDRPDYFGGDIPWITPADLSGYSEKFVSHGTRNITQAGLENSGARLLPSGTVLFSSRAPIGYVAVAANPVSTSQGFKSFIPRDGLLPDFVYYYLQYAKRLAVELASGTTFLELSAKNAALIPIPVAPLNEQRRIVAEIEKQFTRLDAGEAALRRVQTNLKRYRSAVLKAACEGRLVATEAELARQFDLPYKPADELLDSILMERRRRWNGRNEYKEPLFADTINILPLPEGWTWATANQLTDENSAITYGVIKLGEPVLNGVAVLRSSDVRHLKLDLHDVKHISPEIADGYRRTTLKGGEILITVRGTLGGVVVVPAACAGYNISREVAMLSLVNPDVAKSVAIFISSAPLQNWMFERAKGVAYTGINIETLKQLPIPLPPLAEQKRIVAEVERQLSMVEELEVMLTANRQRARRLRESVLQQAFSGSLASQDPNDESALALIENFQAAAQAQAKSPKRQARSRDKVTKSHTMKTVSLNSEAMTTAFAKIGHQPDARQLFNEVGLGPEQVANFYETLRATPDVLAAFEKVSDGKSDKTEKPQKQGTITKGRFRLVELWLEDFKNLKDYEVRFDSTHGLNVLLGWNGTGKSNLFEALVVIFRDLHVWWDKNRWPEEPMSGYRLRYEIDQRIIEVVWNPEKMKRPIVGEMTNLSLFKEEASQALTPIARLDIPLPRFVFGYYSGPTNRLAEHFQPMKQAHYSRLLRASSDDPETLATLLEQRRFFCAETHHAKYVLLAFCYREDPEINKFLEERLRITGFESALFIIRKPRWAKQGTKAEDFWGAGGVMRRVMERLRRFAIAPMVVQQTVSEGYRTTKEDHYYFFLPDIERLHAFAGEYEDARTFFVALESTDFSELIQDVKIQVRVKATNTEQVPITFREMSEGEQQLLMVLGLMRFTKSNESLVLLDEPDTHLNPHWSTDYLKLLTEVMKGDAKAPDEQQTSQILMSTHDPLVIASLVREQIQILRRDIVTGICKWSPTSVDPRGLGFTGILTSEMFGFRSDLDEETLADLDNKVRLMAKEGPLDTSETKELEKIDARLENAGFTKAFSDPYYSAFVRAWGRRYSDLMAEQKFVSPEKQQEIDRVAREVLDEVLTEVQQETSH